MKNPNTKRIACFISPHGYGHAARASGIMNALYERDSGVCFEIFTMVPRWFFEDSLQGRFEYHEVLTDIGLVQSTPLKADLRETALRLNLLLPFDPALIRQLAEELKQKRCRIVLCDIAPMGIAAAAKAGIPSLLVENFTWDWIYEGYAGPNGQLSRHISYLKRLFREADYHVQTEPVCMPGSADLTTPPVSRKARRPAGEIRQDLGLSTDAKMVIVTMGGIRDQYPFLEKLTHSRDIHFVIPGASEKMEIRGNLILLPPHSDFFHPDLVNAGDAVVGKVGYSTLAEVYHAGVPFGYIVRKEFRESRILVSYIENHMTGLALDEEGFYRGDWIPLLPDLLAMPRLRRQGPDGAAQAAEFIFRLITPPDPLLQNRLAISWDVSSCRT